MAVLPDYVSGTISLANGSTTVTGTGTLFQVAAFKAGDTLQIQNLTAVIASVNSNTSLTLTAPWTGTTLTNATYRARYLPDGARVTAQTTTLIELLGNGNLQSIAGLTSAADKGIMFTGAGTAGTFDLTALGRAMLALTGTNGNIPVMTGSGSVASRPIVGTVSAANNALMETGNNANGFYFRFANRLQVCFNRQFVFDGVRTYQLYGSWTFPAAFNSYNVAFLGSARGATGEASWTADSTLGQGDWGAISFSTISANFSSVSVGFNKIASAANPGASAKLYGHLVAIGFY
ncbi:hypothetical protein U2P60_02775 [Brucella sp. H1_1004]|uniref:hypothetical protein n=1 Tax=Brucella sp. H1_1004 TaxID=3110109 RepID=UPI0039B6B446